MIATTRWVGRALCGVLWLCGSAILLAQPVRVQGFLQPDQGVTETDMVRFVLQIEGQTRTTLSPPVLDGLVNLRVVGGPSQSFNSVWNNGRFSATTQFIYTLLPKAAGPAQIPSVAIGVDGQAYRTEPIQFVVAPAPAGAPAPQDRRPSRAAEEDRADVFLRTRIGATEAWVGEPLTLTLELVTAERIDSVPGSVSAPSLSGFWVEEVPIDPNAEAYKATIEGRPYIVYPLERRVLVPQASGDLAIEPYAKQITVQRRSTGDPFDIFSFGRVQTIVRKTQPITLHVKALPQAGRPEDFGGAVGSFSLAVEIDRPRAQVNDAVAFTATVKGQGFLQAVEAPRLHSSSDLKVFDPKVQASSSVREGKLVSTKSWEWILVPLAPGNLSLPELRFSYFDPTSARYKVLEQTPAPLVVERGDGAQGDLGAVVRGDIQLQRRDLAFIKLRGDKLLEAAGRAHERGLFLVLLAAPLVCVPLVVVAGRHRERLRQDRGLARSRRAGARARKRLSAARARLDTTETVAFHEDVARALVEYVADRFDRSAAGLTYGLADELLASRGIDLDLRRRFRSCLESCDLVRFVPTATAERRAEILAEAEQILSGLEKAF